MSILNNNEKNMIIDDEISRLIEHAKMLNEFILLEDDQVEYYKYQLNDISKQLQAVLAMREAENK